jgi:superfamily II DNA/RNA helicase
LFVGVLEAGFDAYMYMHLYANINMDKQEDVKDKKVEKNKPKELNEDGEEVWDGSNEVINTVLPKGLNQLESRVPTEEKDVLAYYYLLKHPGRSLLFVNSIKSARRVDGLLRALGLNCRTIHAQLQQRQRMRALEAFRYLILFAY